MPEHLILRLEGPLQAWGDVALDPRRPTLPCPSRSALAGLLANALGWRYRDADRTTALQDALRFAVREEREDGREPRLLVDYQTADLDADCEGWTSWGVESRAGAKGRNGTQILLKEYLAEACYLVALGLAEGAPVTLDGLAEALRRPARPLFLGRKACPPAGPLCAGQRVLAENPYQALCQLPTATREPTLRAWCEPAWLPRPPTPGETSEVWDRRDFRSNRFLGARRLAEVRLVTAELPSATPEPSA